MKLLIVESPTKAKTMERYLEGFRVMATMGHIKDLPKSKLGVDVDNGFKPHYVLLKEKRKVVKEIKTTAKDADEVYIATDPDREGEAIAYHIKEEINRDAKRVLFYEITREGINQGMENPGEIDLKKVYSQQARRIMDRLVGYKVSPILWKIIKRGLSAGRVQSVVLRLICEREEEIEKFIPEDYYIITGIFNGRGKFKAKLTKIDGKKFRITQEGELKKILEEIRKQNYTVSTYTKSRKRQKPPPPLITSTLQRDASSKFGFSTKKTMVIAQQLYEGVDTPVGRKGIITYMRTDTPRLSGRAVSDFRKFIEDRFGDDFLPDKPNIFASKKQAQGAHEAIRPTDINLPPEALGQFLTKDQMKLYTLIWNRAIASQMKNGEWEEVKIGIEGGRFLFEASSRELLFPGFLKLLGIPKDGEEIPEYREGETVSLVSLEHEKKTTQPPPRYTEGTMVKKMEEEGIGRPSTYAPTISLLIERGYVRKEGKFLVPEELGRIVNSILVKHFPELFNVEFTSHMEEDLDLIESGEKTWVEVLEEFYRPFIEKVNAINEKSDEIKDELVEVTDIKCEVCGRPMVVKWGRYGKFLACSGWPECKNTKPLPEDEEKIDKKCPKCGADLIVRHGRYGKFIACSRYPECDYTEPYTTGIKCPECDGELIERRSKKGKIYYACSNKDCNIVYWNKPVPVKCEKCGNPFMLEKKSRGKIYYQCPRCGHINRDGG